MGGANGRQPFFFLNSDLPFWSKSRKRKLLKVRQWLEWVLFVCCFDTDDRWARQSKKDECAIKRSKRRWKLKIESLKKDFKSTGYYKKYIYTQHRQKLGRRGGGRADRAWPVDRRWRCGMVKELVSSAICDHLAPSVAIFVYKDMFRARYSREREIETEWEEDHTEKLLLF